MPIFKTKNENFFKEWTPQMAYVLGFIAADGAMTINPRGSRYIDIMITDKSLLEDIQRNLSSNHKIKVRPPKNSAQKNRYRLQIGSKIMFNDLLTLNLIPNKSLRLKLPPVPVNYLSHFVRGYFDGDGNVWTGILHKKRASPSTTLRTVFTSGCEKFLVDLALILNKAIGAKGFFQHHGGAHQLVYSIKSSLSLYKFMYNNATMYLGRKKIVFERYIYKKGVVV